jgi:hypothetical protein
MYLHTQCSSTQIIYWLNSNSHVSTTQDHRQVYLMICVNCAVYSGILWSVRAVRPNRLLLLKPIRYLLRHNIKRL